MNTIRYPLPTRLGDRLWRRTIQLGGTQYEIARHWVLPGQPNKYSLNIIRHEDKIGRRYITLDQVFAGIRADAAPLLVALFGDAL